MTDFNWTDNAVETLSSMWGPHSAREIAAALYAETGQHVSRNAVIGKAKRIDLPRLKRYPDGRDYKRPAERMQSRWWNIPEGMEALKAGIAAGKIGEEIAADVTAAVGFHVSRSAVCQKAAALGTPVKRSPVVRIRKRRPAMTLTNAPLPDAAKPLMVSLMDRAPNGCAFPLGEPKEPTFGYCGHPRAEGSSYCPHHHVRVWQRVPAKQKNYAYGYTLPPDGLPGRRAPVCEAA